MTENKTIVIEKKYITFVDVKWSNKFSIGQSILFI